MIFLCSIKGCTRLEHIRNNYIRQKFGVQPVTEITSCYKKNHGTKSRIVKASYELQGCVKAMCCQTEDKTMKQEQAKTSNPGKQEKEEDMNTFLCI